MGQPSLPKWRPRRTVIDLYNERDQTLWYWRAAATVSAFSILIGFLIFSSAFTYSNSLTVSSKSSTIAGAILLACGYALSLVTSLICRSWIFQLDIIFVPCLSSSLYGLIDVIYSLYKHDKSVHWAPSSIGALVLSIIATIGYTTLALLTFRKIHIVRARDAMHRHHSDSPETMMPESELQRQQLLRLLLQHEDAKQQNSDNSQSTFKIDWPGNGDRRSTIGTLRNLPRAVQNSYGSRNSDLYSGEDAIPPPLPPMNSVAEVAPLDPTFMSSDGILPLEARSYIPSNTSYIHGDIPGIVNTRYISPTRYPPSNLPQLQANGYPLEKPENQDLHVPHPSQRPDYHIVDEHDRGRDCYRMLDEQGQRRHDEPRSLSRESRRMEIELADRGKERSERGGGGELEGVEVIGSIRRVETDGWNRR